MTQALYAHMNNKRKKCKKKKRNSPSLDLSTWNHIAGGLL
jgi:hypothetical protein